MGWTFCLEIYAQDRKDTEERYRNYISQNQVWKAISTRLSRMENQSILRVYR